MIEGASPVLADHDDDALWDEFLAQHPELEMPATKPAHTGKVRRPTTAEMTMRDGSPLRSIDQDDLDVDGDPFGPTYDDYTVRAADRIAGMVQSGHGFLVESFAGPAPVERCRYCEGPMPRVAVDWLCEFGQQWSGCGCNWCLCRQQSEAGIYRSKGRPRVQCGAPGCKRRHDAERKRKSRARAG